MEEAGVVWFASGWQRSVLQMMEEEPGTGRSVPGSQHVPCQGWILTLSGS